ncbi:MAG: hypothetical protein WCT08_00665 [Patescibacteria group bacterium]|jgi:hypothetical protein
MSEAIGFRSTEEKAAAAQFNQEQALKRTEVISQPENQEVSREIVDFEKCQIDQIIKAYLQGTQLEWESYSPYLSDHNLATGDILKENLPNIDKIGVAIGRYLREKFKKARMISLYDEYNTDLPDTTGPSGVPVDPLAKNFEKAGGQGETKQIALSDEVKENFKASIKQFLQEQGVIKNEDQENENYLLVSESSKTEKAPELIRALYQNNPGLLEGEGLKEIVSGEEVKDKTIRFNNGSESFVLRSKQGRWMCEALDASAFLDAENRKIAHLVILPNHFKAQQDRVWSMLNSMGFKAENYHNIFFDEKADPEAVVNKIAELIDKAFEEAASKKS